MCVCVIIFMVEDGHLCTCDDWGRVIAVMNQDAIRESC